MAPRRFRYTPKRRAAIWAGECLAAYKAERTDGRSCICNLCGNPVLPTDAWEVSLAPERARSFGGTRVGVAHFRCNREHGSQVVVPAVAKSDRIRRRAIGASGPGLGRRPMAAGRRSGISRTVRGEIVPRLTHAEKHAAFLRRRYGPLSDDSQPEV